MIVARAPAASAFLRGDFGEGVSTIGFDAVREELSFLSEVALDLCAKRGFPGAAEHDVEGGGGGGDDDQEDSKEFEEDAVLHVLLIWRTRMGKRKGNLDGKSKSPLHRRLPPAV